MPNLVGYFAKKFARLEVLLLLGELALLIPATLISQLVCYRWKEYLPGKPMPYIDEIFFRSNCTLWILATILAFLFLWDSHQDEGTRPRGWFFLVTSLSAILLYLAVYIPALLVALTYRGSIWDRPPFGL